MNVEPLEFPKDSPVGCHLIDNEPTYNPALHLVQDDDSDIPAESLTDFGYSLEEVATCPGPIAVAGPFRLLSVEGIAATKEVLKRLRATAESDAGNRASNYIGGGVYKSKFLRDLCACPKLTGRISKAMDVELAPHSIPHMQLYVNFAPEDISLAVDNWHIDSTEYDCVILLEDPASFEGGHFQYFRGTDKEAATLFSTTPDKLPLGFSADLPADRVVSVQKRHAGDVVCQQGSKVIHRAEKLHAPAERTTVVISYVHADVRCDDQNNLRSMVEWNEPGIAAELARHVAWRSSNRLNLLNETLSINSEKRAVVEQLKASVNDVNNLIKLLEENVP